MMLPPPVGALTTAFLTAVDTAAPGLVTGLHLVGSVGYGDFRRGGWLTRWGPSGARSSDVDFVALTARPADDADLAALGRVHLQLVRRFPRPYLDGVYLTTDELSRPTDRVRDHLQVHDGAMTRSTEPPPPVLWHELAYHAHPVRGSRLLAGEVWTDQRVLVDWCRANLAGYWRTWLQHSRRLADRRGWVALTHYGPVWGVLGVSRIDHTITTGGLVSKTGAGAYARATFAPRWHRILDECVRLRTGARRSSGYATPAGRRRDALAFVGMVLQRHGIEADVD